MQKKELIAELVKIITRLSLGDAHFRYLRESFIAITSKIERKKPETFSRKDKQTVSEFLELRYYQGKSAAYWYCLVQLVGQEKAEKLLYESFVGDKRFNKYGEKI